MRAPRLFVPLLMVLSACTGGTSAVAPGPSQTNSTTAISPATTPSTTGTASAPESSSPAPVAATQTSSPAPPTRTATPAASTAGDLDEGVFTARLGRWRASPGEGDEGAYQPNGTWVHAIDPAQAATELAMQACAPVKPLPTPRDVLASDYRDESGARAIGQALRFDTAKQAAAFLDGYRSMVLTCKDAENPFRVTPVTSSLPLVDRRVMFSDGTRWLEFVKVEDRLVKLFIANEQDRPLGPAEIEALAKDI